MYNLILIKSLDCPMQKKSKRNEKQSKLNIDCFYDVKAGNRLGLLFSFFIITLN